MALQMSREAKLDFVKSMLNAGKLELGKNPDMTPDGTVLLSGHKIVFSGQTSDKVLGLLSRYTYANDSMTREVFETGVHRGCSVLSHVVTTLHEDAEMCIAISALAMTEAMNTFENVGMMWRRSVDHDSTLNLPSFEADTDEWRRAFSDNNLASRMMEEAVVYSSSLPYRLALVLGVWWEYTGKNGRQTRAMLYGNERDEMDAEISRLEKEINDSPSGLQISVKTSANSWIPIVELSGMAPRIWRSKASKRLEELYAIKDLQDGKRAYTREERFPELREEDCFIAKTVGDRGARKYNSWYVQGVKKGNVVQYEAEELLGNTADHFDQCFDMISHTDSGFSRVCFVLDRTGPEVVGSDNDEYCIAPRGNNFTSILGEGLSQANIRVGMWHENFFGEVPASAEMSCVMVDVMSQLVSSLSRGGRKILGATFNFVHFKVEFHTHDYKPLTITMIPSCEAGGQIPESHNPKDKWYVFFPSDNDHLVCRRPSI